MKTRPKGYGLFGRVFLCAEKGKEESMENIFLNARAFLEQTGALIWFFISVILIFAFIAELISVSLRTKLPAHTAIVLSAAGTAILMVPATLSLDSLIESKARAGRIGEISRLEAEMKTKKLEREAAERKIEIDSMRTQLALLKNTQASVAKMHDIAEVALLKANLRQTVVHDEPVSLPEQRKFLGIVDAGFANDKVLVVSTHDIDAKFGVDMAGVMIKKTDDDSVVVSGITPKFIGSSKNITATPIKELRHCTYRKAKPTGEPVLDTVTVLNDSFSKNIVDGYLAKFEDEYQKSLSDGGEFGYLNDAVSQLARNFITVVLAPAYKNIAFSDEIPEGSVQFDKYIQQEIDFYSAKTAEKERESGS